MNYEFKNGVKIEIPDGSKEEMIEMWQDATWKMSLRLDPPPPAPIHVERKEYTYSDKTKQSKLNAKKKK